MRNEMSVTIKDLVDRRFKIRLLNMKKSEILENKIAEIVDDK